MSNACWIIVVTCLLLLATATRQANAQVQCAEEVDALSHPLLSEDGPGAFAFFHANTDSFVDMAVALRSLNELRVYFNLNGNGTYGPGTLVTNQTDNPTAVLAVDVDADGDADLVSASYNDDKVAWYENLDGEGTFGAQIVITLAADGAIVLVAADLNGDGTIDLASGNNWNARIFWYPNLGGSFGPHQVVTTSAFGILSLVAADVDGDGDVDLATTRFDTVRYYQNIDGNGTFASAHTLALEGVETASGLNVKDMDGDGYADIVVASSYDQFNDLYLFPNNGSGVFGPRQLIMEEGVSNGFTDVIAADMDNDGDLDLASASRNGRKVAFYENLGSANFGPQRVVATTTNEPSILAAVDVNSDGAIDLVLTLSNADEMLWYESGTRSGNFGSQALISSGVFTPFSAFPVDLDSDGDLDILSGFVGNKVAWYPNTDGAGTFGAEQVISTTLDGPEGVIAADFDGDGDNDVAVVGYGGFDPYLVWFENTDGAGTFGDSQLIVSDTTRPDLNLNGLVEILAVDVDHDLDLDLVLISGSFRSMVMWFENSDGNANFDPDAHIVSTQNDLAYNGVAADFDGDGYIDIAVSSRGDDMVAWHSNFLGNGTFGPRQVVYSNPPTWGRNALSAADLDNDNDVDLVAGSSNGNVLNWFENTDGNGAFGPPQLIATLSSYFVSVSTHDLNDDGDVDVAVVDENGNIIWFENMGGAGNFGPGTVVSTLAGGSVGNAAINPYALVTIDVDRDGDVDFLSASPDNNQISWYPQRSRTAFATYIPSRVSAPATPTLPACMVPSSSACLSFMLNGLSHCVRDTLVLPPNPEPYTCPVSHHIPITRSSRIEADSPGTVSFACKGGILFQAVADSRVRRGDLEVVNLNITGTGAGTGDASAIPGLRAQGPGARLALINVTLSSGVSLSSPTLLGSGTGGCALAAGGGSIEVSGSTISSCSASSTGGGIASVGPGSSVSVSNSRIEGNSAGTGGGAAAVAGGALSMTNVVVSENVAHSGGGGGVAVDVGSTFAFSTGRVESNTAAQVGGGLWIHGSASSSPPAQVSGVSIASNTAPFGGGLAVASNIEFASPTIPAGDVPMGVATLPLGPSVASLASVTLEGNTASNLGGGIFVCDAGVDVTGMGSTWESNVALGSSLTAQSGADAFLCGLSGFSHNRLSPSGIPWLQIEPSLFASEAAASWKLHGPIGSLEWVTSPVAEVEAGGALSGSIRTLDVFELPVEYLASAIQLEYGSSPVVQAAEAPPVFVGGPSVELPLIPLGVADVSGVFPVTISYSISQVQLSSLPGFPSLPLTGDVGVGECGLERGGVVSDGLTSCAPCGPGTSSSVVALAPCVALAACPVNTFRPADNSTAASCRCVPGTWSPTGDLDVPCVACPSGGVCTGGLAPPTAAPGYFPETAGSTLFLECPNPEACQGNGRCKQGYQGQLCGQCQDGFYSLRGSCYRCNRGVNTVVMILLILVAFGVGTVLMAFNLAEDVRYKFAAALIGINGLQIGSLYGRLELDWGSVAAVWFDVIGFANLNLELTSPECSLAAGSDAWVAKLVLTLLLPVFSGLVLGLIAGVFLLLVNAGRGWFGTKNAAQVKSALPRAWFQSLVLLYLPLTSAAFSVFGCRKDESGRYFLHADPVRSCFNTAWWSGLFPIGVISVFVYAFAIPACVVWVLAKQKRRMDELSFVLRFGFLVGRFKESAHWFDAVIMARKLGVVVCMTFFFTDDGKANAAVLVLMMSFGHLMFSAPYRAMFHNGLAAVILVAVILTLFAGTFADRPLRRAGVISGIVINVLGILVGNAWDIYRIAQSEKQVEEDEYFQAGVVRMDSDALRPEHHVSAFSDSVALDDLDSESQFSSLGLSSSFVQTQTPAE